MRRVVRVLIDCAAIGAASYTASVAFGWLWGLPAGCVVAVYGMYSFLDGATE